MLVPLHKEMKDSEEGEILVKEGANTPSQFWNLSVDSSKANWKRNSDNRTYSTEELLEESVKTSINGKID